MTKTATIKLPIEAPPAAPLRFLPIKEVVRRTSLSRATVYRLVQSGAFPRPVLLTGARTAWVEAEVASWMQDCLASRSTARQ